MANVLANWDFADDWPSFTQAGLGTDVVLSRVTSSQPRSWVSGIGKCASAFTGSGTVNWSVGGALPATRRLRLSTALFAKTLTVGGARNGPFRFTLLDSTPAAVAGDLVLAVRTSGSRRYLALVDLGTSQESAQKLWLESFVGDDYVLLDFTVESTSGTNSGGAADHTLLFKCDAWVERSGQLRPLAFLSLKQAAHAAHSCDGAYLGFTNNDKATDSFELYLDELRIDTDGDVALPQSTWRMRDDYPVAVRLRRYSASGQKWVTVLELDRSAITNLRCTFRAHRIEETCVVEFRSSGRTTAAEVQDLLERVRTEPEALIRLDVMAPDCTYARDNNILPTGATWLDDPIYWSGLVTTRDLEHASSGTGGTISAVGFTALLDKVVLPNSYFADQTINAILTSIVATAASGWWPAAPGSLTLLTRANGKDSRTTLTEFGSDDWSLRDALEALARYGNFTFGIAVSGWPNAAADATSEFRLVFVEPKADVDDALNLGGGAYHGYEVSLNVDPLVDHRVVGYSEARTDDLYVNRYEVLGEQLYFDFLSIIGGMDRDQVRESYGKTSTFPSGASTLADGLAGVDLIVVDLAKRSRLTVDLDNGTVQSAGQLQPLPLGLAGLNQSRPSFFVNAYAEGSTTIDFSIARFPAPTENLALTLTAEAYRYSLGPGRARAATSVTDRDELDAARKDRRDVAAFVATDNARGPAHALEYALADYWGRERSLEVVTLRLREFRRLPCNTRLQAFGNLVRLCDGSQRLTKCGTTANGGDDWKYGDDDRTVGLGRVLEVRSVACQYRPDGWEVTFALADAPRDLSRVLLDTKFVAAVTGR